jgi:hypothetical protein
LAISVRIVRFAKKVTDEVVESEFYGALPLSYGAMVEIAPVGLEPTTPG